MKIIVTGATGFVGGAVLEQCIAHPQVTSLLVLTRKEVRKEISDHPKVTLVLHSDFGSYPPALLARLKGAQGCIWAIGGKVGGFQDLPTARRVGVDYTLAAAEAFATSLATELGRGVKFPFVFCSGQGAEWDENRTAWPFAETKRIKGAVEKGLSVISQQHASVFRTFALRPGGVLPDDQRLTYRIASTLISAILASDLARALVKVCLEQPEKSTFENEEIEGLGEDVGTTTRGR